MALLGYSRNFIYVYIDILALNIYLYYTPKEKDIEFMFFMNK